jgi:hypothetical protein
MIHSHSCESFLDFFRSKQLNTVLRKLGSQIAFSSLLACLCACGSRATDHTPAAASLRLVNLEGRFVDAFQAPEAKAVVFFFVRTDCPISNAYAPEIQQLHERFTPKGAVFWLAYPELDVAVEDIRRHLEEYQLGSAALRDPELALVRACQARVTPEAAVFEPGGRLVYHGRIDDRFAAFGVERQAATRHDLYDVLAAITEGKLVTPTSTEAVGCAIPGVR